MNDGLVVRIPYLEDLFTLVVSFSWFDCSRPKNDKIAYI